MQYEVNTLAYFHFRKEIFRRHDPLDFINGHCINSTYRWDYTTEIWEEEEIHCCVRKYHDVIFKRRGNPLGRIIDKKRV